MADKDALHAEWTGHELYDQDGDKIGTVEDVRYGDVTGGLQWLVVESGLLGQEKLFIPAGDVRRSGDRLNVMHGKRRVKSAPKVKNTDFLTQDEEAQLCRFYGLQFGASTDQPAEGCDDMNDVRPAG